MGNISGLLNPIAYQIEDIRKRQYSIEQKKRNGNLTEEDSKKFVELDNYILKHVRFYIENHYSKKPFLKLLEETFGEIKDEAVAEENEILSYKTFGRTYEFFESPYDDDWDVPKELFDLKIKNYRRLNSEQEAILTKMLLDDDVKNVYCYIINKTKILMLYQSIEYAGGEYYYWNVKTIEKEEFSKAREHFINTLVSLEF